MRCSMTEKIEDPVIVTITGPDGKDQDFAEDVVIPYDGKNFAVLVSIPESEEDESDPEIILARIDTDEEDGEAVYVPPTDEEYDAVAEIYEKM